MCVDVVDAAKMMVGYMMRGIIGAFGGRGGGGAGSSVGGDAGVGAGFEWDVTGMVLLTSFWLALLGLES